MHYYILTYDFRYKSGSGVGCAKFKSIKPLTLSNILKKIMVKSPTIRYNKFQLFEITKEEYNSILELRGIK